MPSRLVILTEAVLRGDPSSEPCCFDALARLAHAGHPVAVILADSAPGSDVAADLQRHANLTGGQVVAFFHRPPGPQGLGDVLTEAVERWRVTPAQLHGVFAAGTDLATVRDFGARPAALASHVDVADPPPARCAVHDDLNAFVDALLDDADGAAQ